jgi:hypothetical protein
MTQQRQEPNLFELTGKDVQISYTPAGFSGQAQFTYQGATGSHVSNGESITTQESVLGTLVTINLSSAVDTDFVNLTLLLPPINLARETEQSFRTLAIITRSVGPILPVPGARLKYESVLHLHGTAKLVNF